MIKDLGITRDTRGQAMVEAALTMLLLFMFVFAIWEFGRIMQVRQSLTDAARAGARYAVTPLTQTLPGTLPTETEVEAIVQPILQAASIHVGSGQIDVATETISGTTFTRVTVSYPYRVMTLFMFRNLNMTLTGQSLMRNETSS